MTKDEILQIARAAYAKGAEAERAISDKLERAAKNYRNAVDEDWNAMTAADELDAALAEVAAMRKGEQV